MTVHGDDALPRIGLRVPQYGSDWHALVAFARRAEALGVDSLWVNDHLFSPGRRPGEPAFDALTTLAALAPQVPRVRLGVAVLSASYRPAALAAKMATLLDVISGGRMVVGLGAGSHRAEHRAYGIPFASPAERTRRTLDALGVMRAMFREPAGASVAGLLENAPNLPGPVRPEGPPIWLAAHGPALLRAAGRHADGIVAAFAEPAEVARRLGVARETREPGSPPLACGLYTFVLPVPSIAEAHEWLMPEAQWLGTSPSALMRWLRTTGIVGTPQEVRERLHEQRLAGVTDAVLVLPSRVPADALDSLCETVLPPPAPGATGWARHAAAAAEVSPENNLVHLLVERHVAAGLADAPAVVDEGGAWTYAELSQASARAAGALMQAGARRGDRVAVALRDGRAWCAAFLGAARMGAVPVPLNPAGGGAALSAILADCEPAVVVAGTEVDLAGAPVVHPSDLDDGPPAPVCAVHSADLAYLIYSSGSTGRPKGVMHAHADMRAAIETYAAEVLSLAPGDRCHSVARLFTSLGFGNGFFRVLGHGATAVMTATTPNPRGVLQTVDAHGVTVLTGVPTFWSQLARFLERHPSPGALDGVRVAVSSGDSLPAPVAGRLRREAGLDLIEGLGCSECSNIVISTRPGEHMPGRLGRAIAGVEIRLADPRGRAVPPGKPGRLWIRSASNTTGYWRRPEATRDLVYGPWLRMGDMLMEEDGVYRHMGRADDLFKVDARWVSPTAVEAVLLEHENVEEVGVVGLPDAEGLLRAAAFVVPADGWVDAAQTTELRRMVARALGPHAAPQTVVAVARLPRLPSGKLDRRRLRAAESHGVTATP
jgi:acyl-coenzyme A synthetase/AMP-(fatty) acid ligase/alkanesulfonate monooxygenase SsuD/methylene tetrahydromethanopterin reductase-like flavin-dependent oxidoreductase (luciferase family)